MNQHHLDYPSVAGEFRRGTMGKQQQQRSVATTHTISEPWMTVQDLNNRGCVNITLGNYVEASRLFESALFRHKTIAESAASTVPSCNHSHYNPGCDSCDSALAALAEAAGNPTLAGCNSNVGSNEYDQEEDDGSSLESSCVDDDDFDYEDYMEEDNDYSELLFSSPLPSSSPLSQIPIETSSPSRNTQPLQVPPTTHRSSPPACYQQQRRIRRMSTSSLLPIVPFCGHHQFCREQQQHRSDECTRRNTHNFHHYHEVYCLPIVMDEADWRSASIDDKSFVLIFNTAICNHLWGMHFQRQQQQSCKQSERAFLVANKLYRLALDNARMHDHLTPNIINYRLCIVAILNSLSHVAKTLKGPFSLEGHMFDQMILKAIFWWRDLQEQERQESQQQRQQRLHEIDNDVYEEDDTDIIDSFLDNVFYLIGVPEEIASAAAA